MTPGVAMQSFTSQILQSDKQVVRKISESLLPPAANVVKHLGPQSSFHEYLSVLDSAYGTVDDGDELFAALLNTNQNASNTGYIEQCS